MSHNHPAQCSLGGSELLTASAAEIHRAHIGTSGIAPGAVRLPGALSRLCCPNSRRVAQGVVWLPIQRDACQFNLSGYFPGGIGGHHCFSQGAISVLPPGISFSENPYPEPALTVRGLESTALLADQSITHDGGASQNRSRLWRDSFARCTQCDVRIRCVCAAGQSQRGYQIEDQASPSAFGVPHKRLDRAGDAHSCPGA
jgi:hypothetical protein